LRLRLASAAAPVRSGSLTGAVSPLTITLAPGDCGPVLVLCGEADLTTAPELSAAISAQLDAGVRHLTLDLSGLRFADSATIGVLIAAGRALRSHDGTLVLSQPQPAVARTLNLLGVDRVIPVRGGTGTKTGPDGP
jgi:anti-sigma B factor antagonist